MKSRPLLMVLAAVLVVSGFAFAGWRYVQARENQICAACERPVHQNARTVASVDGKRIAYCCPACALSERRQTGRDVKLISLTDYGTGSPVNPESAFLVRGSEINACARHTATPGLDKHPMESHFDRCSPGVLAFATMAAAESFAREHGGEVMRSAALTAMYYR